MGHASPMTTSVSAIRRLQLAQLADAQLPADIRWPCPAFALAKRVGDLLVGEPRLLHGPHPLIEDREYGGILYCELPTFFAKSS